MSLANVRHTVNIKHPDILFLAETKRRTETIGIDINLDGYKLTEFTRSDLNNDREGGGLAVYTKMLSGVTFKHHSPDLNIDESFVSNERAWFTTVGSGSNGYKTAFCFLYLSCQYPDNRYHEWNSKMLNILHRESISFRQQGFRLVFLRDWNSRVYY